MRELACGALAVRYQTRSAHRADVVEIRGRRVQRRHCGSCVPRHLSSCEGPESSRSTLPTGNNARICGPELDGI